MTSLPSAHRTKRFLVRAIPWRALLVLVLVVATVPALVAGLVAQMSLLAAGGTPGTLSGAALAPVLLAAPLAGLLLLVAVANVRARARQVRALAAEMRHTNGRLAAVIGAAQDAIILLDPQGTVRAWNPAAERLYGVTADDAIGQPFETYIEPSDRAAAHDAAMMVVAADRKMTTDGHHRRGDVVFPATTVWTAVRDTDGAVDGVCALVQDSTGRQASERLAVEAQELASRYRSLVEHLPGVVYRAKVGRWGPVTYVSPHLQTLLGYAPEEWIGIAGIWEEHIHPADLERVLAEDDAEAAGVAESEDREYRMRTRAGTEIWVRDHAEIERDQDGAPVAWNGFLFDVTERKQLESQLLQLAFHDSLTGLANRALLGDRIAHAIARREREPGPIAMLIVDLDDFKVINDAHGHEAGDRLLVAAAERLGACVRADATVARLGGDEFAVLLEDLTDDAAALVVAQRIVRGFEKPLRIEGATVSVRVSVGVAVDATGKRSATWLMRSADTAMTEAKRLGKGRWQAYDPAAHLAAARRLVLEGELRRAVERKQFVLVYQPISDLRTGDIVGTEALIRWNHPTRGLVNPVEFISLLETTGLIEPVGLWVVGEAVRQMAAWSTHLPGLRWTAVNVSSAQLRSDAFHDRVRDSLAEHHLDPGRLTLEVTEGLALDDSPQTVARLEALRALGCEIAIDDFGTGYSSLSYLRRLPIDKLKIDRSLVDGVGPDAEATAVARAIVDLARTLHLTTVAEGIEQPHQADALRELGCDLGQGYLFAKPLGAIELAAHVLGRQAAVAIRNDTSDSAVA
jgi:diguanylate cyclase (GGDEF)-like protein/PAS domain S-box-containing protein